MNIAVFAAASNSATTEITQAAKELGEWIGRNKHTLIYGGSNSGLMHIVATAVHSTGGKVIGIIPRILPTQQHDSTNIDVYIPVDSLAERKERMVEMSDSIIALPGGIGTLDEICSVLAAHTIGYTTKKVLLVNINGCWEKLLALLSSMQQQGFIRDDIAALITVVNSGEEIIRQLTPPTPGKQ